MFIATNDGKLYNTDYIIALEKSCLALYAYIDINKCTSTRLSNVILLENYPSKEELNNAFDKILEALTENNVGVYKLPLPTDYYN